MISRAIWYHKRQRTPPASFLRALRSPCAVPCSRPLSSDTCHMADDTARSVGERFDPRGTHSGDAGRVPREGPGGCDGGRRPSGQSEHVGPRHARRESRRQGQHRALVTISLARPTDRNANREGEAPGLPSAARSLEAPSRREEGRGARSRCYAGTGPHRDQPALELAGTVKNYNTNTDLTNYNPENYYINVSPTSSTKTIIPHGNCLTIPILQFLDTGLVNNLEKPTKFIMICAIRQEPSYANDVIDTLAFADSIKST